MTKTDNKMTKSLDKLNENRKSKKNSFQRLAKTIIVDLTKLKRKTQEKI